MRLERLQAVEVLKMDGEVIILNQETFAVTKLNGTAGWIWEQLDSGLTQEQLVEKMAAEYEGADTEQIRADLDRFIDQMSGIGLIQRAG
ncbi:PqqD family protein [Cohnella sp. AR92]|uniref:PqqD family protein n=1 Tax=Cohnella sp. AR92 TaxID=648716 RepID=UPI000F8CD727|nr:PqqD family protein [Cohnella sp. AR92]RUS45300.1 PqqD family protein [Cohnella sp. AR92]